MVGPEIAEIVGFHPARFGTPTRPTPTKRLMDSPPRRQPRIMAVRTTPMFWRTIGTPVKPIGMDTAPSAMVMAANATIAPRSRTLRVVIDGYINKPLSKSLRLAQRFVL